MPNYFDLTCSYMGNGFANINVPKIHLRYDAIDNFGDSTVIEEDEDISEEGYRVLAAAAASGEIDYTINDACDRFFDEIDIITADINGIDKEWSDLTTNFIADRLSMTDSEYDEKIRDLRWRKLIKEEIKTALEKDLGRILGRADVPF